MTRTLAAACALAGILGAQTPNPPQFVDLMPDFHAVAMAADGRRAWAAAENGLIYRSTDGGATWTGVDAPGTGAFYVVRFHADGKRGWAAGKGRIVHSVDGGLTWAAAKEVPFDRISYFRDLIFDAEGMRGFAVANPAMLLATDDGGISWRRVSADFVGLIFRIAFDASFRNGLIGGDQGLFRSDDGGRSWKKEPANFHNITSVWVSPDGRDFRVLSVANNTSEVQQTHWFRDAGDGRGWTEVQAADIDHPSAVFFDSDTVAVGRDGVFDYQPGRSPLKRVFEGEYESLAFAAGEKRVGLAVGRSARVIRTEDGGRTWRVVHEWKGTGACNRIALQPGTGYVWAVGERVFRSDESGLVFREQAIPGFPDRTGPALDIKFSVDGLVGWMATRKGTILRTTDGGGNWAPADMSPRVGNPGAIASLAFAGQHGIAVGPNSVWNTDDGGAHWYAVWGRYSLPGPLNSVWLTNDGISAWAVTVAEPNELGHILRSDDRGKTWKEAALPLNASLIRIAFSPDGRLGWVTGSRGTILRTENRGRTWTAARISGQTGGFTRNDFFVVDLWFDPTGQYVWAVASIIGQRALLRSVDSGRSWEFTTVPQDYYETFTMTPDGRRGWACNGRSFLATLHETQAPHITRFGISPDFELELTADDPDTPAQEIAGTVEVEGEGPEFAAGKLRRNFQLAEANTVFWPKSIFRKGEKYTFHLRLTDGWNVVTRDFEVGSAQPPAPANVSMDLEELRGTDLAGAGVLLDGRAVDAARTIIRESDGRVSFAPSPTLLSSLADGFHGLAITRGSDGVLKRIGFYKEQLTLKLFRPYNKSYALIVAVGDYPAESGYRKLPNAVGQARELEKALREQGFEVLPPMYDRDATKARIEAAIHAAPAGPEDRLFVYFGGHGDDEKAFQGKPVGYLVPYDGRKSDLWGTAIPLEKIAGEYSSHLRAKHVLFALDSCQSGYAVSRGSPLDLTAQELERFKALAEIEALSGEPGRTILSAGTGGQDALDISGGIFTAALTDGIRGKADTDHNGVVDYFELFAYVWRRVNEEARLWTRKQQPADYQLGEGRWVFVYQ